MANGFLNAPSNLRTSDAGKFASTSITNRIIDAINGVGHATGIAPTGDVFARMFLIRVGASEHPSDPHGVYKCEIRETNGGNLAPADLRASSQAGNVIVPMEGAVFVNMAADTDLLKNNSGGDFDALFCGYTDEATPRMILRARVHATGPCGEGDS